LASNVGVIVAGEPQLLHVVLALRASSRLASLLNSREQQSDQNGNDGDNNQQFDQGKTTKTLLHLTSEIKTT